MNLKAKFLDFIKRYAGSIGAMAGTTTALALKDPASKIVISAYGPIISNSIIAYSDALMEKGIPGKEKVKVAAALEAAINKMNLNLENGKAIRTDSFFDQIDFMTSDFEELMERVVYAAAEENQAKKIKYLGNILGNIAFDEKIDTDYANLLIRIAEQLTYRQLCQIYILRSLVRIDNRIIRFYNENPWELRRLDAFVALFQLQQYGLFRFDLEMKLFEINRLWSDRAKLSSIGNDLFRLMELRELDKADLSDYGNQLSLKHS